MKALKVWIACAALGVSTSCLGAVQVTWGNPGNAAFLNFGGTGWADALPVGSIVQLIYSSDSIIDPISYYNPFTPTGNDQLWQTSYIGYDYASSDRNPGSFDYGSFSNGDAYTNGYAYMRVFQATNQVTYTNSTILYYAQGPATAVTNISTDQLAAVPPGFPTTVDLAAHMASQSGTIFAPMNLFVEVPEPGTIALAFTAMGFFVFRLFRWKKGE